MKNDNEDDAGLKHDDCLLQKRLHTREWIMLIITIKIRIVREW